MGKRSLSPGESLRAAVLADYELAEHELALLTEAVRTVDLLAELHRVADEEGSMVSSPQGRRVHPALVEARQQRIALARLLAALRLPGGEEGDEQSGARPQRRVGARGVYAIGGAA